MDEGKIKVSKIEQIGFAVKDAREAGKLFEDLFELEPFDFYCDEPVPSDGYWKGEYSEPLTKSALGMWGDVEIEILQPCGGDCPWNDAVEKGKCGINHIRFAVDDIDDAIEKMANRGCTLIWRTNYLPYNRAFAYVEHEPTGLLFEMSAPIKTA